MLIKISVLLCSFVDWWGGPPITDITVTLQSLLEPGVFLCLVTLTSIGQQSFRLVSRYAEMLPGHTSL